MKILFFTFYFPPDLSAGSFRANALVRALKKCNSYLDIHVVTTSPNRYKSFNVNVASIGDTAGVTIHRILVPGHNGGMLSQIKIFLMFAFKSIPIAFSIKPDFVVGTTSRLMTGFLSFMVSKLFRVRYFIDIRDIFPESIFDVFIKKSKFLAKMFKYIFQLIEKIIIKYAAGVNVVSEGFVEYFNLQGFDVSKFTIFTNGIDEEFIIENFKKNYKYKEDKKLIIYAGNIGYGQSLEKIIPDCAQELGEKFHFMIIGDGSTKGLLKNILDTRKITNVSFIEPVNRAELLQYYTQADILFLHLNDSPAFKRVLPSKIFEYASIGKPIVAGLSGYAAQFLQAEVPYSIVFNPEDVQGCIKALQEIDKIRVYNEQVQAFKVKFDRKKIMDKMAIYIVNILNLYRPNLIRNH